MLGTRKTLAPPRTSKSLVTKTSIVRNPTISTNRVQPKSTNAKPVLFHMHSQYLTVSSEDTSTYTELEGDDLVDVDYVSEYSLDLSNDEDEEENYEDIQTEVYLRNLFYSIDRLTFDDLPKESDMGSAILAIDLPKNLLAECYVWRQKFRTKKLNSSRTPRPTMKPQLTATRMRPRRTLTEQAIISKVIDWSVENSIPNSTQKLSSIKTKESKDILEKPLTKVKLSSGWMHQPQPCKTPLPHVHSVSSRVALPPIINPKRPLSNELLQNKFSNTAVTFTKPTKSESTNTKEESRQSRQKHHMPTSQSFNEQFEGNNNINNKQCIRVGASSSYSRITLNDLLDQTTSSNSVWNRRSPGSQFISSHSLKLPVIEQS